MSARRKVERKARARNRHKAALSKEPLSSVGNSDDAAPPCPFCGERMVQTVPNEALE